MKKIMGKVSRFPQNSASYALAGSVAKELDHVVHTHGTTLAFGMAEVTVTLFGPRISQRGRNNNRLRKNPIIAWIGTWDVWRKQVSHWVISIAFDSAWMVSTGDAWHQICHVGWGCS